MDNQIQSFNASDTLKYKQKLDTAIGQLAFEKQLSLAEKHHAAALFMSEIGTLFLDYFQFHLKEGQERGIEKKSILEDAKPALKNYLDNLEIFLLGTFEGYDEWERACEKRSNVEAFNSMFTGVVTPLFKDDAVPLNTDDIEDYMRQRSALENVNPKKIPTNTPKTHWWWFN